MNLRGEYGPVWDGPGSKGKEHQKDGVKGETKMQVDETKEGVAKEDKMDVDVEAGEVEKKDGWCRFLATPFVPF